MNEIRISGHFTKQPERKDIQTERGELKLCEANLEYTTKRGGEDKRMWVDVEAVNDMADTLATFSSHTPVRVEGELIRAAWKSKLTDQWVNKHVVRVQSVVELASDTGDPAQSGVADDSDIPF